LKNCDRKTNKWCAQITVERAKLYLGRYGTEAEADAAYRVAAKNILANLFVLEKGIIR
jgi:hypothetical protein